MALPASAIIRAGAVVRVRRYRWRVDGCQPFDACRLIALTGLEAGRQGAPRKVLSPFDEVDPVRRRQRARRVSVRRWRALARALVSDQGPAAILRTAAGARIDLLPHQLEPALAVLRGDCSRLLIADEVGLGKTIQAALVVSELLSRGAVDRVLVLTPAGLRDQWLEELACRFELHAAVFDAAELRRRVSRLPVGVNPWETVPLVIASIDFVKRPEVRPSIEACRWDLIVVDEAHAVAPGSERLAAVAALCRVSPYVVLTTATPHSGDRDAYAALCALGEVGGDRPFVFRRTRRQLALSAPRRVHRLAVHPSAAEVRMHRALDRLAWAAGGARGTDRTGAGLVLAMLHKRAFSCASALGLSLTRRLAASPGDPAADPLQIGLPFDPDGDRDAADEAPGWHLALLDDARLEHELLQALAVRAREASSSESKPAALTRLLRRLLALGEPAIVFTEYRDTLLHLQRLLPFRCALLHGGLGRTERQLALGEFISGRSPFLLATDAAGEGLNLHHHCRVVINLEVPWSPTRLEQRTGRVDRIGQRRPVHVFHLIAAGTGERKVIERLRARVEAARGAIDLDDPLQSPPAIEERASWACVSGWSSAAPLDRPAREPSARIDSAPAEHARLQQVRALGKPTPPAGGAVDLPVAARDRRRCARLALGRGTIVILRSTLDDGEGRPIASHLTVTRLPLMPADASAPAGDLARLVVAPGSPLAESLAAVAQQAARGWRVDAAAEHERLWRVRLQRERGIAEGIETAAFTECQPGLFEQRAIVRQERADLHRRERLARVRERVARAERSCQLVDAGPEVVLVLAL